MNNRLIRDDDDGAAPLAEAPRSQPAAATTIAPPRAQAAPSRRGRGPYADRRQVTGAINPELFRRLKLLSLQSERPLVEIYDEALTAYAQSFAAENKFAAAIAEPQTRMSRRAEAGGCAVTAHVRPDLFKWLRAIHMQTRKTMSLILEEALVKYFNSLSAQRKFNADA
jgi:hypothetical protein